MRSILSAGLSLLLFSWLSLALGQSVVMERGTGGCGGFSAKRPPSTYEWKKHGKNYELVITTTIDETGEWWTPPESARISLRGNLLTITVGEKATEGPRVYCPWLISAKFIIRDLEDDYYHLIIAKEKEDGRFYVMRHLYILDPGDDGK